MPGLSAWEPLNGLSNNRLVGKYDRVNRGKRVAVRQASPEILQVADAPDFGIEGLADIVHEGGQEAIIGSLLDGRAGCADF